MPGCSTIREEIPRRASSRCRGAPQITADAIPAAQAGVREHSSRAVVQVGSQSDGRWPAWVVPVRLDDGLLDAVDQHAKRDHHAF